MGATPQVAWEDVERALDQALTLAPDDRSAFLEQTRSGNPALAAEVERLLIAVEDSGGFLAESGLAFAPALVARVAEHCSLMPGDRFENYEVVRELGRGGMATVYLAQDLRHGRQVALKVLLPELSASFGADRFAREIAFAARLNHPHILPLHDSGTIDLGVGEQVLFYSMPYVDGRSLRDRLREEPQLPIPEALRIASQVADALEYAHRHDVVHRDIKPENILLTDEHAFVADLGIARALDRAATDGVTQPGLVLGTPAYMSPEQSADCSGRWAERRVQSRLRAVRDAGGPSAVCRDHLAGGTCAPCRGPRSLAPDGAADGAAPAWSRQSNGRWPRYRRTGLRRHGSSPRRWRRLTRRRSRIQSSLGAHRPPSAPDSARSHSRHSPFSHWY